MATLRQRARAMFPFFPNALINEFVKNWVELGDADLARNETRQSDVYENFFAGIRRPDGSLRMTEGEYLSTMEAYRNELKQYGVPPSHFKNRFPQLIEGGVTPSQFRDRVATAFTQIASNISAVRQAFADEVGLDPNSLSLSAIFSSALDPSIDPVVFEQKIRRAQIRGEGIAAGFDIPLTESARLAEFGLSQEAARSFFSQARQNLPTLGQLVLRHNDPDDEFDLDEFTEAVVFQDPEQQRRISRLFAQERSLFSPERLFESRRGRFLGLEPD